MAGQDVHRLPVGHGAGVVTSFDLTVLERAAILGGLTIELAPALGEHLRRLDASIALTYPAGSPELAIAPMADRTGPGLGRGLGA